MAAGITVGLISDTHGLLRPQALRALEGVDHIVHAGDIGGPEVLASLETIAPVYAVRGNNDRGAWADALPHTRILELGAHRLCVLHDLGALALDAAAAGYAAVISGHSHRPRLEQRAGVLFVNPGSAGPRRFSLPVAIGFLRLDSRRVRARIQELA
ncbi:MAG TPA: metallophosphoesterase family protein [Steroidobacteraceae bacterium]|nr:metallophosphoesterase family protein [Steroidobacteraceae bacterium]